MCVYIVPYTCRLLQDTQKLAHEMSMSPLTEGYTGEMVVYSLSACYYVTVCTVLGDNCVGENIVRFCDVLEFWTLYLLSQLNSATVD